MPTTESGPLSDAEYELRRDRLGPGEVEAVAPDEAARVLGDASAWRVPPSTSAAYVGFIATAAGRAAWDAAAAARQ
jgi:hypothetical protein